MRTAQEEQWRLKELIPVWSGRTEAIDAKQIRESKKDDGRSRAQSKLRQESWRARERGTGVQSSGQRKRKAAREKRKQEEKQQAAQARERALEMSWDKRKWILFP
jgi:hypothetical protein